MMQAAVVIAYVDRVYAWAVKKTYSREEAEELSQEILFTVIRELPGLRDESRFEPWLWGIARNVERSFRRRMGKQRAIYSYDMPEELPRDEGEEEEQARNEALYAMLREKIAGLSAMYRDIIILYYYDGLSTKQIAGRLKIPEGTVTWRLSEARRKLKKECESMEESALRPVQMRFDITGTGNYDGVNIPFPDVYIDDALSQNILYYCYTGPRTVEELSRLCGVPAYYVEERLKNLVKRDAVTEPARGKYRTDFLIWTDEYARYSQENGESCMMPAADRMLEAFRKIAGEAGRIGFYKAEKSETELFYLYGIMAVMELHFRDNPLPSTGIREKYDGYCWEYIGNMETGAYHRYMVGVQKCANQGGRGSYCHRSYYFRGFAWKKMMYDNYIDVCQDILEKGSTEDIDNAGNAIREGYIRREKDGRLKVLTPAFTKEQKAEFDRIAFRYLTPLREEYSRAVWQYTEGYKKLFPEHLRETAARFCRAAFYDLYEALIDIYQKRGELARPSEGSVCDVLIQFK